MACLVFVSCFLSYASDKSFLFFVALSKNEKFEWTYECEETFDKIKEFFISPPILIRPKEDLPLFLYLSVTKRVMSSVHVQQINKAK